jgi:hypothetical protein
VEELKVAVGSDVRDAKDRSSRSGEGGANGKAASTMQIPALEIEFVDQDTPLIIDAEIKPNDERLLKLYSWWLSLRPSQGLPQWDDAFLKANPSITPFLHLHQYLAREDRLRVAFVGEFLVKALGTDPTGQTFDANHAPTAELLSNASRVFEVARLTRHMQEPLRAYSKRVRNLQSGTYASELIMLPFSASGSDADVLLGATIYTPV